jgi:hypothetical protein
MRILLMLPLRLPLWRLPSITLRGIAAVATLAARMSRSALSHLLRVQLVLGHLCKEG